MDTNGSRNRLLYCKVMRSLRSFTLQYGKLALLFDVPVGILPRGLLVLFLIAFKIEHWYIYFQFAFTIRICTSIIVKYIKNMSISFSINIFFHVISSITYY